jgi:hypothetical protein
VNFSNENSVNFDATPLEAFDDEESDAVEGGGGEGDEVEEIEEGVFDSSQPTKCKRPMN